MPATPATPADNHGAPGAGSAAAPSASRDLPRPDGARGVPKSARPAARNRIWVMQRIFRLCAPLLRNSLRNLLRGWHGTRKAARDTRPTMPPGTYLAREGRSESRGRSPTTGPGPLPC
jgi:hypothetical protein